MRTVLVNNKGEQKIHDGISAITATVEGTTPDPLQKTQLYKIHLELDVARPEILASIVVYLLIHVYTRAPQLFQLIMKQFAQFKNDLELKNKIMTEQKNKKLI